MRKRHNARRHRCTAVLRLVVLALILLLIAMVLPVAVGSDAEDRPGEIIKASDPDTLEALPAVTDPTIPERVEEETEKEVASYSILYTEADAIALAKMGWGEALVTQSDTEITAAMWCAVNRYDCGDPYYRNCKTIESIVRQRGAFDGYSASNPVDAHLLELAYDVLSRWNAEKHGETDVGRTLPAEYLFFHGDGRHNHFRINYEHDGRYYDWSLTSPYET